MEWITEGFEGFSKGKMENGGQNLYVSKNGVLQRIFQYDVNQDGYADLLFANSQSMYERCPVHIYKDLCHSNDYDALPAYSTCAAVLTDLFDSGYDDLVLACQHDGTHGDVPSVIYFGSAEGLSERYKMELPTSGVIGLAVGDYNGDGKKELLFINQKRLRMFYQNPRGFDPADFIDYNIEGANYVAAADLDGDGYCDAVIKTADGKVGILFGCKDGLDAENVLWMDTENTAPATVAVASTAGWVDVGVGWKPCIVNYDAKQYLFCANGDDAQFYTCTAQRKLEKAFSFHCPGATAAVAADLTGNGYDDIAISVASSRDEAADCRIYLGTAQGVSPDNYIKVPVICAVNVSVADLNGNKLIFCRCGASVEQEVPSPVLKVNADGTVEQVNQLIGGDCVQIAAGYPAGKAAGIQVVVPNRTMNRKQGHEDVWVYLGGEDGFDPERKLAFPGHSAVDGTMCDFFDSGYVDVLVTSCYEDALFADEGAYIYRGGKDGFDKENRVIVPALRPHGSAVGDFNKNGYLDLAFSETFSRYFTIYHGSENGYSADNCTKILLGPDDEDYQPPVYKLEDGWGDRITPEDRKQLDEYGEGRWVFACDFNGDGWLDLFVSQILGTRSYIFWGGPEGYSKERMTALLTDGVASANVADLDGDGYPDLLLAQHMSTKKSNIYESYVTVYWGSPDGYQENRKMQLPTSCSNSVTVGDYDGTGTLDIYATSYNNGRCRDLLSFLYHNKNGKFSVNDVQYLFNHSGCGCVSGDFNGDGYTDLAVACHKEYGNHCSHSFVFWGGPDGLSEDRKTVLPTIGPHGMCTVDPGNIMDRGDRERYTSEAMTLPAGAMVTSVSWEGECTSTSWVEVQLRCATDEAGLENAQWQDVESGADVSGLNISGVVQYRLALCAKCACGTPRVTKVVVNYQ